MSRILLINIGKLVNAGDLLGPLRGNALATLPCIDHAWLLVEGGQIASFGKMSDLPSSLKNIDRETVDAGGGFVLPSWCDSHTHLVFAGSRENEFVDKIRGFSYGEIAERGGGILNSARKIAETSEDELFNQAWKRLLELVKLGTGALEIKSGYGLTTESELKILRVIRRLREKSRVLIRSTFLGAHTYPVEFRENHDGYLAKIVDEMLPAIASEKLADYIDVFCEKGFFSPQETETICRAGMAVGLKPKIHANQLHLSGGVETGVKLGALSVDHLETMDEGAIRTLAASSTIGTLLPGAAFFLRMPYPPARVLIDAGAAVALASDFNPGSCPSGNMNLVVSMACISMKMLPEEAIQAAGYNGACAMEMERIVGNIQTGKTANLFLTRPIPSIAYIPYSFGTNLIERVMLAGEWC